MNIKSCRLINIIELILGILIIIVGIYLRYRTYSANLPFWVDEEALLLNSQEIFNGKEHFWQGLESEYISPVLLLLSRFIYKIFGYKEMAFRFIPFVSSVLILPLFYIFLKKIVKTPFVSLLPLLFISINTELLFYSQYFKFYSSDFLCSVLIAFLIFNINKYNIKILILSSLLAVVLAWSAYSAIFYLIGISVCLFGLLIFNQSKENWKKFLIFVIPWFSFTTFYFFQVVTTRTNYDNYLYDAWKQNGNFAPQNIGDVSLLIAYHTSLYPHNIILVFWFIIAISGLFILFKRYGFRTLCFISPIFIMLLLGYFEIFPFIERQTLFLMPIWLTVCAKSIDFNDWKDLNKYFLIIPAICLCLLFQIFKYYDIKYVREIAYNPDYYRMSTAREFYPLLIENYKPNENHMIYSYGRDNSLRIYDLYNNFIEFNDVVDSIEFDSFINDSISDNKIIHIYLMNYPAIGNQNEEIYEYIKNNCLIIKEIKDGDGKYLIFRKK